MHKQMAVMLMPLSIWASSAVARNAAPATQVAKWPSPLAQPEGKVYTYKKTPQADLKIELFFPPHWKSTDHRPGIVFFFGGGWTHGSRAQFYDQCKYLASRGMVAATADYRLWPKQHIQLDKSIEDAKSAMRWMRQHAAELGLDGQRLVAAGGSAGGHLAAATAFCPGFDAAGEDLNISAKPQALVLFNPVLTINDHLLKESTAASPEKQMAADEFSPNAHVTAGAPPAIIFFGSRDRLSATGDEYLLKAEKYHDHAEIFVAADQNHGFFNWAPWKDATLREVDQFLQSLGYVNGPATLPPSDKARLTEASPGQAIYQPPTRPAAPK